MASSCRSLQGWRPLRREDLQPGRGPRPGAWATRPARRPRSSIGRPARPGRPAAAARLPVLEQVRVDAGPRQQAGVTVLCYPRGKLAAPGRDVGSPAGKCGGCVDACPEPRGTDPGDGRARAPRLRLLLRAATVPVRDPMGGHPLLLHLAGLHLDAAQHRQRDCRRGGHDAAGRGHFRIAVRPRRPAARARRCKRDRGGQAAAPTGAAGAAGLDGGSARNRIVALRLLGRRPERHRQICIRRLAVYHRRDQLGTADGGQPRAGIVSKWP